MEYNLSVKITYFQSSLGASSYNEAKQHCNVQKKQEEEVSYDHKVSPETRLLTNQGRCLSRLEMGLILQSICVPAVLTNRKMDEAEHPS